MSLPHCILILAASLSWGEAFDGEDLPQVNSSVPQAADQVNESGVPPAAAQVKESGAPPAAVQPDARQDSAPWQRPLPAPAAQAPHLQPDSAAETPPAAIDHKTAAMAHIKTGDADAARRELDLALAAEPANAQLRAARQLLTRRVGQGLDQASLEAKIAPFLDQRADPGGLAQEEVRLASMVGGTGPQAAAAGALSRPLPGRQAQPGGRIRSAVQKMAIADFPAAERILTSQIEAEPSNWQAYRLRALARRRLKDFNGAHDDSTRAVSLQPKDSQAHNVRALTFTDLRRYKEAVAEADQALTLNAKDANAWATRGLAWQGLKDKQRSLSDFRQAAQLDDQFEALYREALGQTAPARKTPGRSRRAGVLYAVAAVAAALLASLALRRRPAAPSSQPAMRAVDRSSPERDALPVGFSLVKRIGQGGMGVVYEAMDAALQRKVAIKRMRDEIASDPRQRRKFLQEARTVAMLRHPHIVEIFSILEHDDGLFLVFEYMPGQTLDQALDARQSFSPRETCALLEQIGLAVDYAHEQGVVHQDLKPANVMIDPAGIAKVMDFGIARRIQETLSTATRAEVAGTPAYMAPEQAQGQSVKASDIYAMGICCYELLAGNRPFPPPAGLMCKLQKDYRPLSSIKPGLPAAIDQVMATVLDPFPARRYPTAMAFLSDLKKILAPGPSMS
ncbi:MAG TPA: hypothetical protein DEB40_14750 [Elusimicrobia bacterium]|nr:hypothetical protein [Elusimicrobiota bacterium]